MSEVTAVCRAWRAALTAAEPAWLATLTRVEGSFYRRPGARVLLARDRVLAGAVSGGCLERELLRTAAWLTRHGPVTHAIDAELDPDAPAAASGCFGRIELLLEPLAPECDGALALLERELDAERRVALATVIATASPRVPLGTRVLAADGAEPVGKGNAAAPAALEAALLEALRAPVSRPRLVELGSVTALVEVIEPPPHLFVFGSGPDAVPVVRMAAMLGWNVTVCAPARPYLRDRFVKFARLSERTLDENVAELSRCARPLAVIMSHDFARDGAALAALARVRLQYLGVLGPAQRTARLLAALEAERGTLAPAQKAQIFGPAGLALGAETPEEIALSIVAEAQASLAATPRGSLRDRAGKIHAPLALLLQRETA